MKQLISVIGLAPSERPLPEFIESLKLERQRIVKALADYRLGYVKAKPKRKSKAKPKLDPEIAALMKELKMSMNDVLTMIAGTKKEKIND